MKKKEERKFIPKGFSHTQLDRQRGFKGSTIGPANKGRRLTREERQAIEAKMKAEGRL